MKGMSTSNNDSILTGITFPLVYWKK